MAAIAARTVRPAQGDGAPPSASPLLDDGRSDVRRRNREPKAAAAALTRLERRQQRPPPPFPRCTRQQELKATATFHGRDDLRLCSGSRQRPRCRSCACYRSSNGWLPNFSLQELQTAWRQYEAGGFERLMPRDDSLARDADRWHDQVLAARAVGREGTAAHLRSPLGAADLKAHVTTRLREAQPALD